LFDVIVWLISADVTKKRSYQRVSKQYKFNKNDRSELNLILTVN